MNAQAEAVRDGYAIMGELRRRQYNFSKIARDIAISSRLVRETAHGRANNRKALRRMLELGVPDNILFLPPDLQAAKGNAA